MFNLKIKNSIRYLNCDFFLKFLNKNDISLKKVCEKRLHQGSQDLGSYLRSRIRMKGPITVHEYMKECLSNPISVRLIQQKKRIILIFNSEK